MHTFAVALAGGAALLALWVVMRFPSFGARTLAASAVHVLVSIVVLRLMPYGMDAVQGHGMPGGMYIAAFGVSLPALVYAFVSGGWVARAAAGQISRAS